jgi:hypothetical protein
MKVAVYVRVSTQRQALSQTIEQQLQRLYEQSQAQGWPWQEEGIVRDDGYSGASLHRPGLDRLREQVRCAAFDRVVMTAPDRLARNARPSNVARGGVRTGGMPGRVCGPAHESPIRTINSCCRFVEQLPSMNGA